MVDTNADINTPGEKGVLLKVCEREHTWSYRRLQNKKTKFEYCYIISTGLHHFWFGECVLISYIHNSQHSIGWCTTWFSPYVHCSKHTKRDISLHKRAHCYIQRNPHIYSNKEAIAYAIILYLDFHNFVSATSDMSVVIKTDHHDITEISLKVTPRNYYYHWDYPSPCIDDNSRFCLFKGLLVFLLQKHLSYLAFQSLDFEHDLMKVIPETRRAYQIRYLRFYFRYHSFIIYFYNII